MSDGAVRRVVVVRGRVQGVFFRQSIAERARRLRLAGSVENRPDGSVVAVFEGGPDEVAEAVAFCREGPPAARVDAVDVREERPRGLLRFVVDGAS